MKDNLLLAFIKHSTKVYGLDQVLARVRDSRKGARIPAKTILAAIFTGLCVGVKSIRELEGLSKRGEFGKLIGRFKPGESAFRNLLKKVDISDLKDAFDHIVQKARTNRRFRGGTVGNLVVAALDGTELFSSECKDFGRSRQVKRKDRSGNEYKVNQRYEALVACSYVGDGPNLVLGFERLKEGEGELTAAMRLFKELYFKFTHFADVIVMDALYANKKTINLITDSGIDVVIRVKDGARTLIEDAEGLFEGRRPEKTDVVELRRNSSIFSGVQVEVWDEEDFVWEGVKRRLRMVKVRLTFKDKSKEPEEIYILTTLRKDAIDGLKVWQIFRARWEIENRTFHNMKTHGTLTHCFCSDGQAIEAMLYLQAMVHNLKQLFYKDKRRKLDIPSIKDLTGAFDRRLMTIPRSLWRIAAECR